MSPTWCIQPTSPQSPPRPQTGKACECNALHLQGLHAFLVDTGSVFPYTLPMSRVGPKGCLLEGNANSRSIRFAGRYINLKEVWRQSGVGHGYLSKIFSGERVASTTTYLRVAKALDMGLDELLNAIEDRRRELLGKAQRRFTA